MITLLRSIFLARISLVIFLLLSVPVWVYGAVPRLLALPADFTYEVDIISRQRIFDAQINDYAPETLSVGKLFFDVVGRKDGTLFVRGIFNARGATKSKGRSVARIYGVDARTREHVKGQGDRDRTGYLFSPTGLHKQDFVSWPVHYNSPASFTFKGETEIEGLPVYQYEAGFQTSDPPLIGFYRDDGDTPANLTFEIRQTYWIEPVSGRLVTYEDRAIGSSVMAGQESKPYSNSFYTPSRDSVLAQVQEATYEKWKAIIVTYVIPGGVTAFAVFLLLSLWYGSRGAERGKPGRKRSDHLPIVIPIVIILVLTLITLIVWRFAQRITDQQEQLWFSQEIDSMERAITSQVDNATGILENGLKQGFTSDTRERFDWKAYSESIDTDQHYPGLEGVGFAAYIRSGERDAFLSAARSADPTYGISPPGNRSEYAPVMHFEALTKKDKPALGIDLLSDPNLSETLLAARDTGSSVLSPKVVIARDANGYEQIGVMLCTPVYRGGVRLSTTQERRQNITGYLYHLIRVSELVEGALANHNPAFRLQVFDGIWEYNPDKERELYMRKISTLATDEKVLNKTRVAYLLDRAWTIDFAASPESGLTSAQRNLPTFALVVGLVFSLLFSGIVYFLATSRRRAERIAAEMTRELSEEQGRTEKQRALLSLLLEHLPFGVFLSNAATGEILLVNAAGKGMLGEGTEGIIARGSPAYLSVFFKPDGQPYPQEEFPLDMTLSTGAVAAKDDILLRRGDGKDVYIRATSALVQDAPGTQGTDTILILEDITKEQEVNRAKTDFVSLASHQLLTPLTAIGWYVEMLLSGDAGELNADQKQYLDEVSQGNKRMVTLVTDLLNVSRVDLGNLAIHPAPLDLPKTCDSVLSELHAQIETKKLSILKEYDNTLNAFPADPTVLRILLQNLLSNAVKYTPEGGTVRVSVTKGIQDVNVIVADTGYGIPKAEQEKIFSKFFRAENARVNVAEGNGLGLYIVKFAVEQAGGTIRFESEEGKGTTFFVTFPATGMLERKGTKTLQ